MHPLTAFLQPILFPDSNKWVNGRNEKTETLITIEKTKEPFEQQLQWHTHMFQSPWKHQEEHQEHELLRIISTLICFWCWTSIIANRGKKKVLRFAKQSCRSSIKVWQQQNLPPHARRKVLHKYRQAANCWHNSRPECVCFWWRFCIRSNSCAGTSVCHQKRLWHRKFEICNKSLTWSSSQGNSARS